MGYTMIPKVGRKKPSLLPNCWLVVLDDFTCRFLNMGGHYCMQNVKLVIGMIHKRPPPSRVCLFYEKNESAWTRRSPGSFKGGDFFFRPSF
mmetsp:Transcript_19338/g.29858  ORF Transcript_19338/g.29858 Transcript_19338/m.29858 type:complete len:91 (-) Transcript_19338:282-554(-)